MFYTRIFIVLCLIASVQSCNKQNDASKKINKVFTGVVMDYSTGKPIDNAIVHCYVFESMSWSKDYNLEFGMNSTLKRKDQDFVNVDSSSILSNDQGLFATEKLIDTARKFYLYFAVKDDYIPLFDPLPWNFTTNLKKDTIFLDKPSYMKINLSKSTTSFYSDTLLISSAYYSDQSLSDSFVHGIYKNRKLIGAGINSTFTDTFSFKQFNKLRVVMTLGSTNGVTKQYDVDLNKFGTKEVDIVF
jgi:hypothetical protein